LLLLACGGMSARSQVAMIEANRDFRVQQSICSQFDIPFGSFESGFRIKHD